MSPITVKKLALIFSMVAFAMLLFGSVAAGARWDTAFIRGIEAALLFGLGSWGLGGWLLQNKVGKFSDRTQGKSEKIGLDKIV
jgi:hypothetical protein